MSKEHAGSVRSQDVRRERLGMKRVSKEANEREIARVIATMQRIPIEALCRLSATDVLEISQANLDDETVRRLKNEYELEELSGGRGNFGRRAFTNEQIAERCALERIARIAAKSYAYLGDNEQIGSEEALRLICVELSAFDPTILRRNERRALPQRRENERAFRA